MEVNPNYSSCYETLIVGDILLWVEDPVLLKQRNDTEHQETSSFSLMTFDAMWSVDVVSCFKLFLPWIPHHAVLYQWFSSCLILHLLIKSSSCYGDPTSVKLFLLLLYNWNFSIALNCNTNNWYAEYLTCNPSESTIWSSKRSLPMGWQLPIYTQKLLYRKSKTNFLL